jgi:hydroxymethylpyrimidine pyrophosphatase-like HAD family hydrolase
VTFRAYRSAKPYVVELGLHLPLLCCNGALVKDASDDRVIELFPIDRSAALQAVEYGIKHRIDQCLYIGEHYVAQADVIEKYSEGYLHQWRRCDDLRECLDEPTLMVRYFGNEPFLEAERHLAHLGFEHVQDRIRDIFELSLMQKGVSKGSALARLARDEGVGAHEVVAIGDGRLDASMLRIAALGIAMANAAPETLAAADEVTASNDEDGVALALERLLQMP